MSVAVEELNRGWQVASTTETRSSPGDLDGLAFVCADVPGTVAGALRRAGKWRYGCGMQFDNAEHWFRCRFGAQRVQPGECVTLRFGGIATLAEAWLNGEPVLSSESMFEQHDVDITPLLREDNELAIVCRPLSQALGVRRRAQPAARWRTRVVSEQQLRWFRTTLLGRAPGFSPEPEPVGPWRPITLIRGRAAIHNWTRRTAFVQGDGVVVVEFDLRHGNPKRGRLFAGGHSADIEWQGSHARAEVAMRGAQPWWPHTHGKPVTYPVRAEIELDDGSEFHWHDAPAGFCAIANVDSQGLTLEINGRRVFCRGVVWTPVDAVTLAAAPDAVRRRLELLRDAGINMIRVVGTAYYEDETFHRLCDELGILVWQDFMFANMDYPFADGGFGSHAQAEADAQLRRLARHASTAVICGNSEIEQQAAMLGLEPDPGRGPFFGAVLPGLVERWLPGLPYFPSAPCGGDLPFRTNNGIANYFGVGAYLLPLEDARRAAVRFASECLAFSHVPEPELIDQMSVGTPGGISPVHPVWKRGVPRDAGAGWDFEDVRDHYLRLLYGVDPSALRYASAERYFELSRLVTGEVMAEVFGEWRRHQSACGGGIVLQCGDLQPGAGWGIVDSSGQPKAAYWFLRRALAPIAVWTTDEGLNGVDIHVANDGATPLRATLRGVLYQQGARRAGEFSREIEVAPNGTLTAGFEAMLGRFADAAYAYRFGLAGHDAIVVSLHAPGEAAPFAQAFRFVAGRPWHPAPVGLSGSCRALADGSLRLTVQSARVAWGVRVAARGFQPDDQYFGLEPGVAREIRLAPVALVQRPASVAVSAVNAESRLVVPVEVAA